MDYEERHYKECLIEKYNEDGVMPEELKIDMEMCIASPDCEGCSYQGDVDNPICDFYHQFSNKNELLMRMEDKKNDN